MLAIIYNNKFANDLHAETHYYKVLNKKAVINALWIYLNVSHNAGRRAIQEAFEYNYYR